MGRSIALIRASHRLRLAALGLAVLMCLAAAHARPPAARASEDQASFIMDDDLLVYRDDATRDAAMRRMRALGADGVRVTVLWRVVADRARRGRARNKRFRRLGAANPRAYPRLNWDRYDRLVRACQTLGMTCYLDVTFPGPSWAHEKAPRSQRRSRATWKPRPKAFGQFVTAVGRRYSGTFRDENDGRGALPRVGFWAIGNEPNQPGWLMPQWSHGRPYAPLLYRRLFRAGRAALQRTGHGGDTILAGETAPLGSSGRSSRSPIRPRRFIRQLFCVDGADRALRGRAARRAGCSDFGRSGALRFTVYAHHPYTKRLAPTRRDRSADSLTMANIGELPALLDRIAANTGRAPAAVAVMSTEFGYETNPPDRFSGIPRARQAAYLAQGDYLAWLQPRVLAQTQFLLRDVGPLRRYRKTTKKYWFTYQSGLYTARDHAKPAARAWAFPFLVTASAPGVAGVWGQLKFLPNVLSAAQPTTVQLQWRPADGSGGYGPVGPPIPVTSARGFFTGQVAVPGPGKLRATWPGNADALSLGQDVK